MASTTEQQQSEKVMVKAQGEITGQASEPVQTAVPDSNGLIEGLEPAYRTYLEGRETLAEAFKQRERQDQEALREAQRQYRVSKEVIEKAIRVREKAELDARIAYTEELNKAANKVSQVYREAIETAIRVREKAELDARVAYTQELDKAVNKASQVYWDKMEEARIECTQSMMNGRIHSIQTSAQAAGAFERDVNVKGPNHEELQPRETIPEPKKSFLTAASQLLKTRPG